MPPSPTDHAAQAPLRLWGPFILWIALIFALSAYPRVIIPQSKYISWDKLAHVVEFGVLGILTGRALYFSGNPWLAARYFWLTLLFGLAYAVSDELHQLHVKGRYASPYDVAADFLGVALGVWAFSYLLRKGLARARSKAM